jgi:hypothetical protein
MRANEGDMEGEEEVPLISEVLPYTGQEPVGGAEGGQDEGTAWRMLGAISTLAPGATMRPPLNIRPQQAAVLVTMLAGVKRPPFCPLLRCRGCAGLGWKGELGMGLEERVGRRCMVGRDLYSKAIPLRGQGYMHSHTHRT